MQNNRLARGMAIVGLAAVTAVGFAGAASAAAPAASTPATAAAGSSSSRAPAGPVKFMQANVIITFTNFTNETVHVRMDGRNFSGVEERDLLPGDHMRAEGHTAASSQDLSGVITYQNGQSVSFWGYNPMIGDPSVGFGSGSNWQRFIITDTYTFTESGHKFIVERASDDDYSGAKIFSIRAR